MSKQKNTIILLGAFGLLLSAIFAASGRSQDGVAHRTAAAAYRPLEKVPKLTPAQRAVQERYGHFFKAAERALHDEDYSALEDDAQELMATPIGSDIGQTFMVEALHAEGRDTEAMPFLKAISDADETNPQYELPYALLLAKTGQWSEAISIYNRTLPFLLDGDLLRTQNDFTPAVQRTTDFEAAIKIGMGIHCRNTNSMAGRPQQAEGLLYLRQAVALAPNNALAHYQYGMSLAKTVLLTRGRQASLRAEAQAEFNKAAALDDGDVKAAALKELPVTMKPR